MTSRSCIRSTRCSTGTASTGRKDSFSIRVWCRARRRLKSTRAMLDAIAASGEGSFLAMLKTFAKREPAGLLSFPHEGVTLAIDFRNSREAFVIATAVSFVGNALWSFGARPTPGKAAWFFAINTIGLFLNMLIAWILERAHAHYLLIALTVLVVVPMFNFAGHRLFTFSRS